MFHYCGDKLNAIRWSLPTGDVYKLHYFQPVWDAGTEGCASMLICACYGPYINVYDVPLLYNLKTDPMEKSPLDATHSGYKEIVMVKGSTSDFGLKMFRKWKSATKIGEIGLKSTNLHHLCLPIGMSASRGRGYSPYATSFRILPASFYC